MEASCAANGGVVCDGLGADYVQEPVTSQAVIQTSSSSVESSWMMVEPWSQSSAVTSKISPTEAPRSTTRARKLGGGGGPPNGGLYVWKRSGVGSWEGRDHGESKERN